jgi:hypothetical protein
MCLLAVDYYMLTVTGMAYCINVAVTSIRRVQTCR